jgi:hypothetical protein
VVKLVKIPTKLAVSRPSFEVGGVYTITQVEQVKTALRGFEGLRVTAVDEDGEEHAEMLWLRETVGNTSKLGAFVSVLGDDTDNWIGKRIRIVSWTPKNRQIALVQEKKK